ncbi:hypothetical protein NC796_25815 [Aliifodinibius sp. S!AR15-10]|uniref:hypothetical protein n=1 Tax=Aliifodinibius sp. S!AR15-10 TaxID=2950437 RepID=UPI0028610AC5|nr:hypothetical protein [Aliifodinibius sp. S!AR15-10]MDR8394589.1 hypothetical protein [Aliifodinibius sp. S!AR15-10]
MKSLFTFLIICAIFISCNSKNEKRDFVDNETTTYINTHKLHGIIFKPNHQVVFKSPDDTMSVLDFVGEPHNIGWIPNREIVFSFNNAFIKYWEKAKTDSLAELNNLTPILWKTIKPMEKQVIGFVDTSGQKKLWVNIGNFDEGTPPEVDWKKEPIIVNDGGPYSYIVKYDVAKDSIYSLTSY